MLRLLWILALLVTQLATAHPDSSAPHPARHGKPAALVQGLGHIHHPVSTTNALAQRFFDQGLAYVYAFNHQEAVRSFSRAALLDPKLAMAHWGLALALGPNYNAAEMSAAQARQARAALERAQALGANGPANEQAWIAALAVRLAEPLDADPAKAAQNYRDAMRALMQRYPDDLDAATLFADAAMLLRPWRLWNKDGTPVEGTTEILSVLESVLVRDPNHIGANQWNEVLKLPRPPRAYAGPRAVWHFARGMAFAARGRIKPAETERAGFARALADIPADEAWGRNLAADVFRIAACMLDGNLALAKGERPAAIALFEAGVAAEAVERAFTEAWKDADSEPRLGVAGDWPFKR